MRQARNTHEWYNLTVEKIFKSKKHDLTDLYVRHIRRERKRDVTSRPRCDRHANLKEHKYRHHGHIHSYIWRHRHLQAQDRLRTSVNIGGACMFSLRLNVVCPVPMENSDSVSRYKQCRGPWCCIYWTVLPTLRLSHLRGPSLPHLKREGASLSLSLSLPQMVIKSADVSNV